MMKKVGRFLLLLGASIPFIHKAIIAAEDEYVKKAYNKGYNDALNNVDSKLDEIINSKVEEES